MVLHSFVCMVLPVTCIAAIWFQRSTDTANAFSIVMGTSGTVISAGLAYTRYQQIVELYSLVQRSPALALVNKAAILSAKVMFLTFFVFVVLFFYEVKYICSTLGDILIYGFGTVYMWLQCLLTSYLSPLYYSKMLILCRVGLASLSLAVLTIMLVSGIVANALYKGVNNESGSETCAAVNTYCRQIAVTLFCVFLMSYCSDHKYLTQDLQTDLLLDDRVSVCSASFPEYSSTYGPIQIFPNDSWTLRKSLLPLVT